ncbi:uncharacterized protein [Solanum tuberosum]|uniref:uncharacterized protein n=1 Tax=Solanum tuberosum TaxID=4113 RepID=UPI0003D271AC|nr:PREDICTED: uncharacterized protein LOC102579144 [Solanum tuberosum]
MQEELFGGKVKMIGKEEGGLYILSSSIDKMLAARHIYHKDKITEKIDTQLLHQTLGHVSSYVLKKLLSYSLANITKTVSKCVVCPCAKQARLPFHVSVTSSLNNFDLLHMDL